MNRKMLLLVLSKIRFLASQSIPLRGKWDKGSMSEINSNFYQILKEEFYRVPELKDWLERKKYKYTSPRSQNELLQAMALNIQRNIVKEIRDAEYFTIMYDESADVANHEQLVMCISWVDDSFEVHEEFIGMYPLDGMSAAVIVSVIKDILLRLNLDVSKCRGQCYDGAAVTAGKKNGVAKQIQDEYPKCLYTYCHGHALNLAVKDSISRVSVVNDVLETVAEIAKLVKKSPQRDNALVNFGSKQKIHKKVCINFAQQGG